MLVYKPKQHLKQQTGSNYLRTFEMTHFKIQSNKSLSWNNNLVYHVQERKKLIATWYRPTTSQTHADKLGWHVQSVGHGTTLRYWDYTTDRLGLGVMAQKVEEMLPKLLNKWLCNVQLFQRVWILEILRKHFGYPYPYQVLLWKQFWDIRIWLQTHYPAGYPTGKPDSNHLWFPTEVSMDRIRIGYPAGYLWFFRIRIGFGYLFLKKIGSGQDQDICLISITKFPWEWFKMSQMMVVVEFSLLLLWFLYSQKNQNYFISMHCTHHNQW